MVVPEPLAQEFFGFRPFSIIDGVPTPTRSRRRR